LSQLREMGKDQGKTARGGGVTFFNEPVMSTRRGVHFQEGGGKKLDRKGDPRHGNFFSSLKKENQKKKKKR